MNLIASMAFLLVGVGPQSQKPDGPPAPVIPTVQVTADGESLPTNSDYVGSVFGALKCDSKSNLFFRTTGIGDPPMEAPVTRISNDGRTVTRFDHRRVPGFENDAMNVLQFAVSPSGEVYEVLRVVNGKN